MSEGFIGLSVLATFRDPPSAKVRGLVTNVVAGQLTLSEGMPGSPSQLMFSSWLTDQNSHLALRWIAEGKITGSRVKHIGD